LVENEEGSQAILHLDMDAFFPAVEVLDNPSLRGKPVIVGGSRERGVVSSASYEARKFGVHSALPMATAMRRCPQGVFLPVRMSRYKEISEKVFGIFHRFTPLMEAVSIDEAFLDVTGSQRLFGTPETIALTIKKSVVKEIGITVSAGIAPNKFLAKIASDLHKPDGLTIVPGDKVNDFLHPLPIEKLWGVGEATQSILKRFHIRTIGDLSRFPLEALEKEFGKHGTQLHLLSLGIDKRNVEPFHEIKSIGHEDTFSADILEKEALRKELLSLAIRVSRRMRAHKVQGRSITLKIKYNDFVQVTRSRTLPHATDDGSEIFRVSCHLLEKTEAGKTPVRLAGISLSNLCSEGTCRQPSLFPTEGVDLKSRKLNLALDKIHDKYGAAAVLPGILIKKEK